MDIRCNRGRPRSVSRRGGGVGAAIATGESSVSGCEAADTPCTQGVWAVACTSFCSGGVWNDGGVAGRPWEDARELHDEDFFKTPSISSK